MKTMFMSLVALFATSAFAQDGLTEIELKQDGTTADQAAAITSGNGYTEYTTKGGIVQVAFKMENIDVTGCDYILIKFAESLDSKWDVSFYNGQGFVSTSNPNNAENPGTVSMNADRTEMTYELPDGMTTLPQICLLAVFKDSDILTAKVVGVYKHTAASSPVASVNVEKAEVSAIYNAAGKKVNELQTGINIIKMTDGSVKKVLVK